MSEPIDSNMLTQALSNFMRTTAENGAAAVAASTGRPVTGRASRIGSDEITSPTGGSSMWPSPSDMPLSPVDSDWGSTFSRTDNGSRSDARNAAGNMMMHSVASAQHMQLLAQEPALNRNAGNNINNNSLYPSSCTTPESFRKDDVPLSAGWDTDPIWTQFFGVESNNNNSFTSGLFSGQQQALNSPSSNRTTTGQDVGYPVTTSRGVGYWPDSAAAAEPSYAQIAGRGAPAAAAAWSTSSMYPSNLFSSPNQMASTGYASNMNSRASLLPAPSMAWANARSTGYGYGTPVSSNYNPTHNNQSSDYSTSASEIAALEEQFKDFKLKPKILTDQYKFQMGSGRKSRSRNRRPTSMQCVFCLSNGEQESVYRSHILKDPDGRIICPVLRMYCCPICNNNGGDYAHTIKYCPKNKPCFKNLVKRMPPMQQQQHPDQRNSGAGLYAAAMARKQESTDGALHEENGIASPAETIIFDAASDAQLPNHCDS